MGPFQPVPQKGSMPPSDGLCIPDNYHPTKLLNFIASRHSLLIKTGGGEYEDGNCFSNFHAFLLCFATREFLIKANLSRMTRPSLSEYSD